MALNKLILDGQTSLASQVAGQNDNIEQIDEFMTVENENWAKVDTELSNLKNLIEPILLYANEQQGFAIAENSYHRFTLSTNSQEAAVDLIVIRLGANPYVLTTVKEHSSISVARNVDGSSIYLTSTLTARGYHIKVQG